MKISRCALCCGVTALAYLPAARAIAAAQLFPPIQTGSISVNLTPVATGLTAPVDARSGPVADGRLYVTDQAGKVQIYQNNALQGTLIDVSSRLTPLQAGYDERGLLGFAFDPSFNDQGSQGFHKVYTYTSEAINGAADFTVPNPSPMNCQNVVAEWTVDPATNQVLPASRREIMRIDKPLFNHNGGPFQFGPDGKLYIALGDGGNANDVGDGHNAAIGNAQDTTVALGKILRIDPHGNNSANHQYGIPTDNPFVNATAPNTVKEIYAYGVRNPYRFSFDSGGTHQLIVADVGQDNIEEIDKVTKGANLGWHYKEGTFAFDPTNGHVTSDLSTVPTNLTDPNGSAITLTDPVAEYDHTQGIAIVGGFVYRGSLLPQLQGKYVFGDFSRSFGAPSGRLFYLDLTTGEISEFLNGLKDINPQFVKGMGEGADHELYLLTSTTLGPAGTTGTVFEIVPEPSSLAALAIGGLLLARRRRKAQSASSIARR
jgi:glucose/arabinose dehydrogenase